MAEVGGGLSEVEGRCHVPELHNMGVHFSKPYLTRNDYNVVTNSASNEYYCLKHLARSTTMLGAQIDT